MQITSILLYVFDSFGKADAMRLVLEVCCASFPQLQLTSL